MNQFSPGQIDFTHIVKMALGVGSRGASTAGGMGKLYFDDIRVMRAPTP